MRVALRLFVCAAFFFARPGGADAASGERGPQDFLAGGIGYFDINQKDDEAAALILEYRWGRKFWILKPFAGAMATSSAGLYGFAGLRVDLPLGKSIVLTPSIASGLYGRGSGKDLGHTVEFRSQIELSYLITDRARLGINFSHLSNAGLGDDNPGAETLAFTVLLPF